jgi:glutaredoxin 3
MTHVKIYTTRACPYCVAAKRLLTARGVAYDEIDVTGDDAQRARLVQVTGRRTVPQIFIGGEAIGGYDDLAALDREGELARKLSAVSGQPSAEAQGEPLEA